MLTRCIPVCLLSDGSNNGGFCNSFNLWTITTINNNNGNNNSNNNSVVNNFVLIYLQSLRHNSDGDDDDHYHHHHQIIVYYRADATAKWPITEAAEHTLQLQTWHMCNKNKTDDLCT